MFDYFKAKFGEKINENSFFIIYPSFIKASKDRKLLDCFQIFILHQKICLIDKNIMESNVTSRSSQKSNPFSHEREALVTKHLHLLQIHLVVKRISTLLKVRKWYHYWTATFFRAYGIISNINWSVEGLDIADLRVYIYDRQMSSILLLL